MAVRLTDKEIQALAKKIEAKERAIRTKANAEKAKKALPEAKKIIAALNALPDAVMQYLYNNRYRQNNTSASALAKVLIEQDDEAIDVKIIEADVTLAAHSATSMSSLCRTLGI